MADFILKKSDLAAFLNSLAQKFEVFGPRAEEGRVEFAPVAAEEIVLDFQNSHLSPKGLFFPQSERMFEFSADPGDEQAFILKEVLARPEPRVVFGLRPCDAKAFALLDRIFENDQYTDVYWVSKREATTLIGLGCQSPGPTCFCTSVGCGPFHEEGLDVLASDLGDKFLLRVLTEKGGRVLEQAEGLSEAGSEASEAAAELGARAEAAVVSEVAWERIQARAVLELFDSAHWDRVQEPCLNCGTCTFVCPTCHCFDIQDEVAGLVGDRVRNWDTCMSWLFTVHGTGHNPRPGKKERVRQRFMHKFKYIPLKRGGELGCVGCGRCILLCPVNIDVRDVVREMNA